MAELLLRDCPLDSDNIQQLLTVLDTLYYFMFLNIFVFVFSDFVNTISLATRFTLML